MRILVTRPRSDAEDTAAELSARGHSVLAAPLLEIRHRDGPEISLENIQAILATSSNGVHAFARRTKRRDVPLFAVGAQTARIARDAGFTDVRSADGDAHALAAMTIQWAKPGAGALLHAAGAETKGELAESLSAGGFEIRAEILYDAVPASELPREIIGALKAGEVNAVLHFSPRSARIFSACVVKAGLTGACARLDAYCISRATADALEPLRFRAIHVASRPNQTALLALLA